MTDTELTAVANRAWTMFAEGDRSPAELAQDVAYGVGAYAARFKVPKLVISKWLQGAYGSVWVRRGNLNPGMDAKEVRAAIFKAYDLAVSRMAE